MERDENREPNWVTFEKAQAEYLSAHDKALDEAERRLSKELGDGSTVDAEK